MIAENILFELGSKSGLFGIRKRFDGLWALGVKYHDTIADYVAVSESGDSILFFSEIYDVREVVDILYKVRITRFTFNQGASHSVRTFKEPV